MNMEVALGAEAMHQVADMQNDAADHDEYHAAGSVMSLLNGAVLTKQELDYILRWLEGLKDRI